MRNTCLAFELCVVAGCATLKDNTQLQQLAAEDQYDRLHNVPEEGHHDLVHQQQVRQLLAGQKLRTSRDYFSAATVLQHADSTKDYLLANELAKKAVALRPADKAAKTLVAQSWDRYQRSLGQPQWYGTQRRVLRDGKEYLQLLDTTKVTDDERRAYYVPTLAEELAYFNHRSGQRATSLRSYMLTDEQERALLQRPSGVELIGSYENLFNGVRYPAAACQHGITGKVLVQATVAATGTVSQAFVVKSLGYGCDEEAVRLLKTAQFSNTTGEDYEIRIAVPFGSPAKP